MFFLLCFSSTENRRVEQVLPGVRRGLALVGGREVAGKE
jgi:hypothetical protein